ncbi:MAG: hypothetical protein V7676_15825 [Parasphingorhabdus sp.]|uniref:hypothetical protein n=1 Tax=Parasphingorhabdus sp. TaxID=2709688 RepID=UPI0030016A36
MAKRYIIRTLAAAAVSAAAKMIIKKIQENRKDGDERVDEDSYTTAYPPQTA